MRVAKQCIAAMPPSAELVGDKGYDSDDLRAWLAVRGTVAVIPPKKHRKVKLDCDPAIYKQRNVIERMFCRFKDWRRVATRFDRNIKTFMATIAIAATVIAINWLHSSVIEGTVLFRQRALLNADFFASCMAPYMPAVPVSLCAMYVKPA